MVALGTKIIGNYGAMIPLWEGEVVAVETFDVGIIERVDISPSDPEVKVRWDNGSTTWMVASEIDAAIGKLSGIGIYTEEGYYG